MRRTLLILLVVVAAFIGAVTGSLLTFRYLDQGAPYQSIEDRQTLRLTSFQRDSLQRVPANLNFEAAAKNVTPAVVHIRAVYGGGEFSINPLDNYFNPQARSSGSGVIISDDGYIVTNNHVIEEATNLEVVLNNNQRFYAKVVGRDPNTDLALLKIKSKNLPFIKYGNSDQVGPGEWVLAIGNPFDLNSTVTAGIVSAKARNIGILRDRNSLNVESFIQTDAAVNPGNSGGALVNLRGELIGINTAIATATGGYAGYSFAIPVSLVKKIMDDLLEFGEVQRGLLGVQIRDVTADIAENYHLDVVQGVFIDRVNRGSAASESGLEAGDVITAIDSHPVNSVSELQEWVARNRPGESVSVKFRREQTEKVVKATLKNFDGTEATTRKEVRFEIEGGTFEDLSYRELTRMNLEGGVRLRQLADGKWKASGLTQDFIITYIDKVAVNNVEDLNRILEIKNGGILVEGVSKNLEKGVFGVDW